jgi:hypothetical protein
MSDSRRKSILAQLAVVLKTTGIRTVYVSGGDLDLTSFRIAELPVVNVVIRSEAPQHEKSMHAIWLVRADAKVSFVEEITGSETLRDSLTKEIKDALGGDITLQETCIECRISNISYGGAFPLWDITLSLDIVYEQRIDNA